jgi:hypothetical protein
MCDKDWAMKTKQLIMAAGLAAISSSATPDDRMTESGWLINADQSLTFRFPGECTAEEFASLPRWKTVQCRSAGTGLTVCQDKILTVFIDSQPAYPNGGVPNAYCRVDVELTAQAQATMKKNLSKIKLPPGCYFIRDGACTVCNPPNVAEGCGAGYTPEALGTGRSETFRMGARSKT